jgi:hypothetical protein
VGQEAADHGPLRGRVVGASEMLVKHLTIRAAAWGRSQGSGAWKDVIRNNGGGAVKGRRPSVRGAQETEDGR